MKHLKGFNESIERKDIGELIDEMLDNLSKKKKLSKSETKFMNAASKNQVYDASIPKLSGDFWSDMSNPHNTGTMWMDKNGTWYEIKTLEEEREEKLSKTESDDDRWKRKKKENQEKYIKENPGLKETLNEYLNLLIKQEEERVLITKKLKSFANYKNGDDYTLSQKIEYSLNGLESLFNQFGDVLDKEIDENGEYVKKEG
jgi:hypothetical protein